MMKIYVLKPNSEYKNCYYIELFDTTDEALSSIQNELGYLSDYIFIEGQELKLALSR